MDAGQLRAGGHLASARALRLVRVWHPAHLHPGVGGGRHLRLRRRVGLRGVPAVAAERWTERRGRGIRQQGDAAGVCQVGAVG